MTHDLQSRRPAPRAGGVCVVAGGRRIPPPARRGPRAHDRDGTSAPAGARAPLSLAPVDDAPAARLACGSRVAGTPSARLVPPARGVRRAARGVANDGGTLGTQDGAPRGFGRREARDDHTTTGAAGPRDGRAT